MSHLVLVLGPSGSGRTTALGALAALGFAVSDTTGAPTTALLGGAGPVPPRLALVVDLGLEGQQEALPKQLASARDAGHRVDLILLDADEQTLVRRAHVPLELAEYGLGPAVMGAERDRLVPLQGLATAVIDTTRLTPAALRARVAQVVRAQGPALPGSAP